MKSSYNNAPSIYDWRENEWEADRAIRRERVTLLVGAIFGTPLAFLTFLVFVIICACC